MTYNTTTKQEYDIRRQEMINLRLGGMKLREIANIYGISRERVRQVVGKARPPKIEKPKRGPSDKRRADRKYALELLGGICIRCGFSDYRALQIDHINGGGSRELKRKGSGVLYRDIINMSSEERKEKYQVLCANCNWIKRSENGENNSHIYLDRIRNER